MTEPKETSRGYELDGPDNDGDIEVVCYNEKYNDIGYTMWFTREDLELMLKMFEK
jgi:hypothetical protein